MSQTNEPRHIFYLEPDVLFGLSRDEVEATVTAMKECGVYKMPYPRGVMVELKQMAEDRLEIDGALRSQKKWEKMLAGYAANDDKLLSGAKRIPSKWWAESFYRRIGVDLDLSVDEVQIGSLRRVPFQERKLRSADGFQLRKIGGEPLSPEQIFRLRNYGELFGGYQTGIVEHRFPSVVAECTDQENEEYEAQTRARAQRKLDDLRNILIVSLCSRGIEKVERKPGVAGPCQSHDDETVTVIRLAPQPSQVLGGAHASPRMHLRRGHTTHQRYGKGRQQTKLIFIEPVWVNSDADFAVHRAGYVVRA